MPPRNRGADAARPWTAAGIIAVGASLEQRAAPPTRQFVRDGDVPVEVLHSQDNNSRVNQLAATREACRICIAVFGGSYPILHSVSLSSRFCGAATSRRAALQRAGVLEHQ